MTINEIKKALYKEKPIAYLEEISKNGMKYSCCILSPNKVITFDIPLSDMGDAKFNAHMESQLLIRWIVNE